MDRLSIPRTLCPDWGVVHGEVTWQRCPTHHQAASVEYDKDTFLTPAINHTTDMDIWCGRHRELEHLSIVTVSEKKFYY